MIASNSTRLAGKRFKCADRRRAATAPVASYPFWVILLPSFFFSSSSIHFTRLTEFSSFDLTSRLRALRNFNKNSLQTHKKRATKNFKRYHQMDHQSIWSEKQLHKYDNDGIIEHELTSISGDGCRRWFFCQLIYKIAHDAVHDTLENTRFITIR